MFNLLKQTEVSKWEEATSAAPTVNLFFYCLWFTILSIFEVTALSKIRLQSWTRLSATLSCNNLNNNRFPRRSMRDRAAAEPTTTSCFIDESTIDPTVNYDESDQPKFSLAYKRLKRTSRKLLSYQNNDDIIRMWLLLLSLLI